METLNDKEIVSFWAEAKGLEKLLEDKKVVIIFSGRQNDKLFYFLPQKLEDVCFLEYADDVRKNKPLNLLREDIMDADILIVLPDDKDVSLYGAPINIAYNLQNTPYEFDYNTDRLPGTLAKPLKFIRDKTVVIGDHVKISEDYLKAKGGVHKIGDINSGKSFLEGVRKILEK